MLKADAPKQQKLFSDKVHLNDFGYKLIARSSQSSTSSAKGVNTGDSIHYGQRFGNIGEAIQETLNKLELNGGPDAFVNIKYMIPSYESAVLL